MKKIILLLQITAATMYAAQDTGDLFVRGAGKVSSVLKHPFSYDIPKGEDTLAVRPGKMGKISPWLCLKNNLARTGIFELGTLWDDLFALEGEWRPSPSDWKHDSLDTVGDKMRFLAKVSESIVAIGLCMGAIDDMSFCGKEEAKDKLREGFSALMDKLGLPEFAQPAPSGYFYLSPDNHTVQSSLPGYEDLWMPDLSDENRLLCAQVSNCFVAPVDGQLQYLGGFIFEHGGLRQLVVRTLGVFYKHDFPNLLKRLAVFIPIHFPTVKELVRQWHFQINVLLMNLDPNRCFCKHGGLNINMETFDDSCDEENSFELSDILESLQQLESLSSFETLCLQGALDARWPDKYPEEVAANLRALPYADKIAIR